MAVETAPVAAAAPAEDPYDLGDTDFTITRVIPDAPAATTAETPSETPAETTARTVPPKDPETGRFIKVEDADKLNLPTALPDHPPELIALAQDFGFDADEIASTPTETLRRDVRKLQRQHERVREQLELQRTIQEGQVRAPAAQPTPVQAAPADEFAEYEEEVAPAILKLLRAQAAKINQLQQTVGAVQATQEQRLNESRTEWIDRLMQQHGSKEKLGSGPLASMPNTSPQARRRMAVLEYAKMMAGKGATIRQCIEKIPEALQEMGMQAESSPAPAPSASPAPPAPTRNGKGPKHTPQEWADAGLQPPTHRAGGQELKGEALAIANLTRRFAEEAGPDSDIMDTLL